MYYKLIEWTIFGHIWTDYKRQVPLQLQIRGQSVALINKDVTGKISMSGVEPEMGRTRTGSEKSIVFVQSFLFESRINFFFPSSINKTSQTKMNHQNGIWNKIFIFVHVKWAASSQWSFRPNFAWGSTEITAIGTTYPTLDNMSAVINSIRL